MEFQRHGTVTQDSLFSHRFDRGTAARARQAIGLEGERILEDAFPIRLVLLVRHDRNPRRNEGPNPTRVIEVLVGVYDVTNRLRRQELLDRRDCGLGALVVLRPLDDDDMIAELEEDAHRCAAVEEPVAFRDLLSLGLRRRWPRGRW